jgi:hypothetical protein
VHPCRIHRKYLYTTSTISADLDLSVDLRVFSGDIRTRMIGGFVGTQNDIGSLIGF